MFAIKIAGKEILSFGRNAENPQYPLTSKALVDLMGGGTTDAGVQVSENTSLTFSAVYSAVRVIAESLAVLPLQVFKSSDKGRDLLRNHPLYFRLHDEPNGYQSSFTWRETSAAHQCLWGNAYSFIHRDKLMRAQEFESIHPQRVAVNFDAAKRKIFYVIDGQHIVEQSNMLHIPALSLDGIKGKSPIQVARESIGLGLAMQKFGGRFFGSGANLSGVLEHPGKLGEVAHKHLKDTWQKQRAGIDNSHSTAILEEGMKYQRIGVPPEEAQFLTSRKFQVTEIARWFRLPPHLLADLERSNISNIEPLDIGFVKYSLAPWLKRWEQELNRKLLTEQEKREGVYFEFNVDGLLRGDIRTRAEWYSKMIAARVLSPNEVRRMENRNDYEGGDSFENPNTSSNKAKKHLNGSTHTQAPVL